MKHAFKDFTEVWTAFHGKVNSLVEIFQRLTFAKTTSFYNGATGNCFISLMRSSHVADGLGLLSDFAARFCAIAALWV